MDGTLTVDPDGRLLVTRPALPGEADRLRALAGLPVPEVVAGDDPLVLTWAPPAGDLLPLAAAVAAVLAAAHDRGVTHGPLAAAHVRAGGVVDGWAGGDPAGDVAALGRLLLEHHPLPPAVAAVARRATADDPASRPTMRAVADALAPAPPAVATRDRPALHVPAWLPGLAAVPVAVLAAVAWA